jgi:hypothetical protein
LIDYGRGYHENVNQLTVQHLKEHVKDPTYRDVIQNVVSAISTSCLGGADTFIERKGQLDTFDTLLESVPEETPVQWNIFPFLAHCQCLQYIILKFVLRRDSFINLITTVLQRAGDTTMSSLPRLSQLQQKVWP